MNAWVGNEQGTKRTKVRMRREQKFDPLGNTVRGWLAVQKCVTFMQVCLGERDGMQFRDDIGSAEMGAWVGLSWARKPS